MTDEDTRTDPAPRRIREEVIARWDANAEFWDSRMGEGNLTHRHLVSPTIEHLLAVRPGESVLEVACGNGQLARRLSSLGARVSASDASPAMLAKARARTEGTGLSVEYLQIDASESGAFEKLGPVRFDAVVCSMAMMDMPEIGVLAGALPRLVGPSGRFVFAVLHPCFNGARTRKQIEEEDAGGTPLARAGVFVSRYSTPRTEEGHAMVGQPKSQWYFDRPLNALLRPFFAAGLVLDALEEPVWPEEVGPDRALSWIALREIPQILVGRLRPRIGATPPLP